MQWANHHFKKESGFDEWPLIVYNATKTMIFSDALMIGKSLMTTHRYLLIMKSHNIKSYQSLTWWELFWYWLHDKFVCFNVNKKKKKKLFIHMKTGNFAIFSITKKRKNWSSNLKAQR